MSTPSTFKKAICRSANELKSKADKNILVLIALNYSREIEHDSNYSAVVDEYYDFLKENLYSNEEPEEVITAAELDLVVPNVNESLINEIKNNPAPISSSIKEKHEGVKNYDWNAALSNAVMEKKEPTVPEFKNLKVTPIPDAILYGDLQAYGISNLEKIKLISRMGDISDDCKHDQVYEMGLVPRSFKLGNREVTQHLDSETNTVECTPHQCVQSETDVQPLETELTSTDDIKDVQSIETELTNVE